MPEDVYIVDRLVISVEDLKREPTEDAATDRLTVRLSFKNPMGSPGSTRRPPAMEAWDAAGRVFPSSNAEWAEPVLPDTVMDASAEFEIAADASDLELVFAPGDEAETRVPLTT